MGGKPNIPNSKPRRLSYGDSKTKPVKNQGGPAK